MHFVTRGEHLFHAEKHILLERPFMADVESHPVRVTKGGGGSRTALNSHCQSTCKLSDVDDSLCLPDPVIHCDVAPVLYRNVEDDV